MTAPAQVEEGVSAARAARPAKQVVELVYWKITLSVAAGILLAGLVVGIGYAALQYQLEKEAARRLELQAEGAIEDPREYDLAKHSVLIRARTPREAAERFCSPKPLSQRDACIERTEERIKDELGR